MVKSDIERHKGLLDWILGCGYFGVGIQNHISEVAKDLDSLNNECEQLRKLLGAVSDEFWENLAGSMGVYQLQVLVEKIDVLLKQNGGGDATDSD